MLKTGIAACAFALAAIPATVHAQQRFFVSDDDDNLIYRYSPAVGDVGSFGVTGGNGNPDDIVCSHTLIYVLDSTDEIIYRYDYSGASRADGRLLRTTSGAATNAFRGMAIDYDNVYVVSNDNRTVYLYSLNSIFTGSGNLSAISEKQLPATNDDPRALTIDDTYLYVLDRADRIIYRYDRSTLFNPGTPTATLSRPMRTSGGTNLSDAEGIAKEGDVMYVVQRGGGNVNALQTYSVATLYGGGGELNASATVNLSAPNDDERGLGLNAFPFVVSIVRLDADPTNAASVQFLVTFSEPVTGISAADFGLTVTGSVTGASITGTGADSGDTRVVTVSTGTGNGTIRLDFVDDNSGVDTGSLPMGGTSVGDGNFTTGQFYTVGDLTPPTVDSITAATTGPTNANSIDFTVVFSEDVVNFNDAADIIVNHTGTAHSGISISGSGDTYTVTVTGITGDGSFTIEVNTASDVEDTNSNALADGGLSDVVFIDNTAPDVTSITAATTGPTNANSIDFTVVFSEDVVNFDDAADIIVNHSGTAHSGVSISGSGDTYTVTITGISGDGSFTIEVSTTSDVEDEAGNALSDGGLSAAVAIDNTAPEVTSITPATLGPTNATSVQFTVVFSEDVVNFGAAADIIVNHTGTAHTGVNISGSGDTYTVTVTGISGDGSFTIEVDTGESVEDEAGNALSDGGLSAAVAIDNTAPNVVSITPATLGPTNATSVQFTVVFSEDVVDFDAAADIIVNHTGTAHSGVSITGSGDTYTVTITGISGDGSFTIEVSTSSDVEDEAGNALATGGLSAAVAIDNTPPNVTLLDAVTTGPTNATDLTFVINFDEEVAGLDESHLSITHNGTTHTAVLIDGDGTSFTITLQGVSGDGDVEVEVLIGSGVTDLAGNPLATGGAAPPVVVDNTNPQVDFITPVDGQTIDITFDELNGMGSGVLDPSNYTIGGPGQGTVGSNPDSVQHLGGNVYRLVWNSGSMVNGSNVTITVGGGVQDAAGNFMDGSADEGSAPALPVTLSGFAID